MLRETIFSKFCKGEMHNLENLGGWLFQPNNQLKGFVSTLFYEILVSKSAMQHFYHLQCNTLAQITEEKRS